MSIKYGCEIQRDTDSIFAAVHTGIYVSDWEVIHFNIESSNGGSDQRVESCTLAEFSQGAEVIVREEPENHSDGERIVARARKILNDPNNEYNDNYGVLFGKNCQDFTEDCFINA